MKKPIDIIGKNWTLTLPSGKKDHPSELLHDGYAELSNKNFFIKDDELVFNAPTDGYTTSGSHYPRCELREMLDGGGEACWDIKKGKHSMEYTVKVNHVPKTKSQIVVGQIHDDKDDVIEVRFSGGSTTEHLAVDVIHNSINYGSLDDKYVLGSQITLKISTTDNGFITVENKTTRVLIKALITKKCYFKVGSYVQSNPSKGDKHDDGEVSLLKVSVNHS